MEKSLRPTFSFQLGSTWLSSEKTTISDLTPKPGVNPQGNRRVPKPPWLIDRIVSGGQTGVDRAALDVAIALQIPHGGWCPLGRIAEDGPIPDCYQLEEHPSPKYADRTKRNVIDSDATLVLYRSSLEGGTLKTFKYAGDLGQPCLKICLKRPGRMERVCDWLVSNRVRTLNIAGPRASKEPEIYQYAFDYLMKLLTTDN